MVNFFIEVFVLTMCTVIGISHIVDTIGKNAKSYLREKYQWEIALKFGGPIADKVSKEIAGELNGDYTSPGAYKLHTEEVDGKD